jgi:hypothetical protein
MWDFLLGLLFAIAMPQVAGGLVAWRLGWRGAAVWAWPLVAATDAAGTWYIRDRVEAAEAVAAGHFVCGTGRIEVLFMVIILNAVIGTIVALSAKLMFGRDQAASH